MKRIWLSILLLGAAILFGALTSKTDSVSAYAPPPASNYYALRGGMNLKIVLPPLSIVKPNRMRIGVAPGVREDFTFNSVTGQVTNDTPPSDISVTTTRDTSNSFPERHNYVITVRGFVLGGGGDIARYIKQLHQLYSASASTPPPAGTVCVVVDCSSAPYEPYEYKLDYAALTRSNAKNYADWLRANPTANDYNVIYLSDRTCGAINIVSGTTLCMKTTARLTVPGYPATNHILIQSIPVFGGISVEGNVAGTGTVSGFVFDENSPKAIAVGGAVNSGVTGGAGNVQNYTNNSTVLKWDPPGTVGAQIASIYNNASSKAAEATNNPPDFSGGNIYLNASNRNLRNSGTTTLSSPPEGKLWKINGNTTFTNVTINGSGTIMVNGNVTINNSLRCATGARFGIIATGTITINLAAGTGKVACGAYVARGGDLIFSDGLNNPDIAYEARGIFVTRGSIQLPSIADDVAFRVKYDSAFAADPTVLFKELLSIIFSTVS